MKTAARKATLWCLLLVTVLCGCSVLDKTPPEIVAILTEEIP